MQQYRNLVQDILEEGTYEPARVGGSTYSIFGHMMRFNLKKGFPLVTGKPVAIRMMFAELVFFLRGHTNANELNALGGGGIWDKYAVEKDVVVQRQRALFELAQDYASVENLSVPEAVEKLKQADANHPDGYPHGSDALLSEHGIPRIVDEVQVAAGELGPVYGAQWRGWRVLGTDGKYYKLDQLKHVIDQLKHNPKSRRHIVSGWNPQYLPNESQSPAQNAANGMQALPPCHLLFQFKVTGIETEKPTLHCLMYQRSADVALGVPFNIASYAALTHLVANELGYNVGDYVHVIGDAHIYEEHVEGMREYLTRPNHDLADFKLPEGVGVDNVDVDTLVNAVTNYKREPQIKFELY